VTRTMKAVIHQQVQWHSLSGMPLEGGIVSAIYMTILHTRPYLPLPEFWFSSHAATLSSSAIITHFVQAIDLQRRLQAHPKDASAAFLAPISKCGHEQPTHQHIGASATTELQQPRKLYAGGQDELKRTEQMQQSFVETETESEEANDMSE